MATKKAPQKTTENKPKKAKPVTNFAPLKFQDYTIKQKRSGRYEVLTTKGKNINGTDKLKLLLEAKVLKGSFKKATTEETPTT